MKYFALALLLFVSTSVGITLASPNTQAMSGSEFQAGRIIDNTVFFNPNTMSPDDIQRFLNAKVPSCDTNGTKMYSGSTTRAQYGASKGYPAPYTCLKDYYQTTTARPFENGLCNAYSGGYKSAAQIIYEVSIACGINPQVLLVLLQKEQSLLTDDWPWPTQYASATGFGCPDTAPCDAQFGAFFDQVYYAARQFKRYDRDQTLFRYRSGRVNYIQYNPSSSCGGGDVYIQNQATAGLYNYTPYQPNEAALSNLYGTGDSCSAYGNRNFWRLFREWFNSVYADDTDISHPNGTIISDGQRVYLIEANTRRHILGPNVFASHRFSWNQVKKASNGDYGLPIGTPLGMFAPGTLIRSDGTPTYTIEYEAGTLKKQAVSYDTFMGLGMKWSDVIYIPSGELPTQTHSMLLTGSKHPSGSLVVDRSQGKIYYVEMGTLRYVSSSVFQSYNFSWDKVVTATPQDLTLPISSPFEHRQGAVFYANNGIYIIDRDANGAYKRPVGPWECYANKWYFTSNDWSTVPIGSLPARTGPLFTC